MRQIYCRKVFKNKKRWDFPGSPMIKTWHFHLQGECQFDSCSGNKDAMCFLVLPKKKKERKNAIYTEKDLFKNQVRLKEKYNVLISAFCFLKHRNGNNFESKHIFL